MKSSIAFLSVCLCASVARGQSTSTQGKSNQTPSIQTTPSQKSTTPTLAPAGSSSSSGSSSQLKARGPEAVAETDPNRVVATIGGKQVSAKQALDMLKSLPPADRKNYEGKLPAVLQQLYMFDQISNEATKLGLDQQDPWKEQLQLARANILTQAYITKMASSSAGPMPEEAKQYYDSHPADFDQVKLSGILISFSPPGTPASSGANARTEAQAQEKANELEKKIKAGGDFSALARTDSDSQQSAARGGDLGTYSMTDAPLPANIKSAISKLQAGQVSEPVRTPPGFWIFKVDSRTKVPLDQARAGIIQKLEADRYKIQVQDQDFFNASKAQNIPSLQRPSTGSQPQPQPQAKR